MQKAIYVIVLVVGFLLFAVGLVFSVSFVMGLFAYLSLNGWELQSKVIYPYLAGIVLPLLPGYLAVRFGYYLRSKYIINRS